jgi:hypothetical protein
LTLVADVTAHCRFLSLWAQADRASLLNH